VERYSIVEPGMNAPEPEGLPAETPTPRKEPLRFPPEDGGRSLAELDLEAALQLLAERAQYITAASGAAIALRANDQMICRASAGPSAPELGAHLQIDSGLSGESIRTRRVLCCDDASTDTRVNRESCRALGIASVVILPLVENKEVLGVFELFSDRPYAFEERDLVALQRISEMIRTAMSLANTPREKLEAETQVADEPATAIDPVEAIEPAKAEPEKVEPETAAPPEATGPETTSVFEATSEEAPAPALTLVPGSIEKVHKCETCGFPVSEGRKLCLDCEAALPPDQRSAALEPPAFSAVGSSSADWLGSYRTLIVVLIAAVLIVAVLLRLR